MEIVRHLIEEYEISSSTLVVEPLLYGQKIFSKISELEGDVISPFRPLELIKESCLRYGSSFEGRKTATRKLIGFSHKVPISISPSIYLFPTTSPENPRCIWVAQEHIYDYKKGELNGTTIVRFMNKRVISIPISINSFENQLVRTMMLKAKINKRNEKNSTSLYSIQQSAESSQPYKW